MSRRARRGGAAVVAVVLLVVLQLVAIAMVSGGAREQAAKSLRLEGLRATYGADGALAMAAREVVLNTDEDGDGGVGSVSAGGSWANDPALGPARMHATAVVNGSTTTVTAESEAGAAQRRLSLLVTNSVAAGERPGLVAEVYHSASGPTALSSIDWNSPWAVGTATGATFASQAGTARWLGGQTGNWAMRLSGKVTVPADGTWTFSTASDDGSDLWINGVRVVNNDGLHAAQTASGAVALTAGAHDIVIRWFEAGGNHSLGVTWSGPGVAAGTPIPASAFTCSPGAMPPVVAHSGIQIWGDGTGSASRVDSFDSTLGAYGASNSGSQAWLATHSTASQAVQMSNLASVAGDVSVGPGGDPNSGIVTWSGSQITGSRGALTTRAAILLAAAPSGMASAGYYSQGGSVSWSASARYSGMSLWGATTVVTVSGDVTIVSDGDVTIADGARIVLAPGATLRWYIGGNLGLSATSGLNEGGMPRGCQVFLTGSGRSLTLADNTRASAWVVNPLGSLLVHGTSEFAGTYYGTSLTMTDQSRLHADRAWISGSGSGGGGGTIRVAGWAELP